MQIHDLQKVISRKNHNTFNRIIHIFRILKIFLKSLKRFAISRLAGECRVKDKPKYLRT